MKIYSITIFVAIVFLINCTPTKPSTNVPTGGNDKIAAPNASFKNTYWRLTEIRGKEVDIDLGEKNIYIKFKSADNKLEGFAGCNSIMGSYKSTNADRIKITAGSTRMFCQGEGMKIENELMLVLSAADYYSIEGNTLQLYKSRMGTLAKFEGSKSK